MAALIPSLNSCLRRMTPGEKRVARRLESHLEDDYLCWYDVPIGGRGQHPDFFVLHPSHGLLILEVKDWKLGTIRHINRHSATIVTRLISHNFWGLLLIRWRFAPLNGIGDERESARLGTKVDRGTLNNRRRA